MTDLFCPTLLLYKPFNIICVNKSPLHILVSKLVSSYSLLWCCFIARTLVTYRREIKFLLLYFIFKDEYENILNPCLNSSDGHDTFVLLVLKETLFNTIKIRSFDMYFLVERLCHICLTPKFFFAVCPFPSIQDATVIPHLMALLSRSRYTQEYICQIFSHCCKVRARVNVLTVNLCVFLYMFWWSIGQHYLSSYLPCVTQMPGEELQASGRRE